MEHEELEEETADTYSLENDVLRRERTEELKRAILTLSFKEQHIFYRKYYFLQQIAQIAAELGMTERSVEGQAIPFAEKTAEEIGR